MFLSPLQLLLSGPTSPLKSQFLRTPLKVPLGVILVHTSVEVLCYLRCSPGDFRPLLIPANPLASRAVSLRDRGFSAYKILWDPCCRRGWLKCHYVACHCGLNAGAQLKSTGCHLNAQSDGVRIWALREAAMSGEGALTNGIGALVKETQRAPSPLPPRPEGRGVSLRPGQGPS